MNWLLTLIVTVFFFIPSCAMDRAHFIELNKRASELAKEKNWKGLREALIEIGREMPAPTPVYLLRMASVEARLADLEVQLSTMPADAEWQLERLDLMLQDLNEIGEGIGRMRQRFRLFTQGHQQRVN